MTKLMNKYTAICQPPVLNLTEGRESSVLHCQSSAVFGVHSAQVKD